LRFNSGMTAIPDDALLQHASRAKGKVVLITGECSRVRVAKVALTEWPQAERTVSAGLRRAYSLSTGASIRPRIHEALFDRWYAGLNSSLETWTRRSVARPRLSCGAWEGVLSCAVSHVRLADVSYSQSEAIARRCDVTSWEDQCDLFTAALSKFGAVDVVVRRRIHAGSPIAECRGQIPNAGVNEIGTFTELQFKDGRPLPPNLKTLDINLTGVLYSKLSSDVPSRRD
jgi:hypothetical protein